MRDVLYFDDLYDLASTVDNLMENTDMNVGVILTSDEVHEFVNIMLHTTNANLEYAEIDSYEFGEYGDEYIVELNNDGYEMWVEHAKSNKGYVYNGDDLTYITNSCPPVAKKFYDYADIAVISSEEEAPDEDDDETPDCDSCEDRDTCDVAYGGKAATKTVAKEKKPTSKKKDDDSHFFDDFLDAGLLAAEPVDVNDEHSFMTHKTLPDGTEVFSSVFSTDPDVVKWAAKTFNN